MSELAIATAETAAMTRLAAYDKEGKVSSAVSKVYWRALKARSYHSRRFDRCMENFRMYSGLDAECGLGQWPMEAVQWMLAKRRQLTTYNLAKGTVDNLASTMIKVPFDPEYFPMDEEITSLTEALDVMMRNDKEVCHWPTAYWELMRGGLVFEGVLRMEIDTSWHRLGNIGYSNCLPNSWYGSPMWKTMRMRDLKICWHEQWLDAQTQMEQYGDRNPSFKKELELFMAGQTEYGTPSGVVPFDTTEDKWGSSSRFIHEYRMIRRPVNNEYIMTAGGKIPLPRSNDQNAKMHWLDQMFGEGQWNPDHIFEESDYDDICIKSTICPSVSLNVAVEEESECEIQVKHPPFNVWSADRINGEPHSVMDLVKDMQVNVNYIGAMLNYKLQIEGFGSAKGIDRSGFANEEEYERAKVHGNDPGEIFDLAPGSSKTQAKPIYEITASTKFPQEAYQYMNSLIDKLWPQISNVVAARRGVSEGAQEPAKLFEMKLATADRVLSTMEMTLRLFWLGLHEDYLLQAANQYSLGGVERKFTNFKSGEHITVNKPVMLPDGSIGIRNDMSKLKEIRHRVSISEIQETPTKKIHDIEILSGILDTRSKIQSDQPSVIYTCNSIIRKIDQFDAEDKKKLDEFGALELQVALNNVKIKLKEQEQQINPAPPAPAPAMQLPGQPAAPAAGMPANIPPEAQPQAAQPQPMAAPQGQAGG
jgi:hypothetical protein